MSAHFIWAIFLTLLAWLPSSAGAKDLVDQCVGGRWDEIIAQSGIVHSRKFPELGLSEKLAFECPSFVNQVLFAESLDTAAKRKVFESVGSWPHEKVQVFYLKLKLENQRNAETVLGNSGPGPAAGISKVR